MDSKVKSAVNELADLFGTTPKGTTVYFNEYNYTPIPQPVTEAVKAIMNDYSELNYRIGLYSVTVLDTDKKKITNAAERKPIESKTAMGSLHDDFVTGKITENELKDTLTKEHGYGKRKADALIDKWKPAVIKSSLSDYFPINGSQAKELEDKISQFNNKSDIRTTLEDYFHIYDDYAEMSVEDFDNALDKYFNESSDESDEYEFDTNEIDDFAADYYDGDDYSESLE